MPCAALQTSPPSTVGPLPFKKWLFGAKWGAHNLAVVWGWLRCAAGGGGKRRHVVARRSARALQCVAFNKLVLLRGNSASFVVFVIRLRVSIVLLLPCDLWLVAWVISVICVGVLIYGCGVFPILRRVQIYKFSDFVRTSLFWHLRSEAPGFCMFRYLVRRPPYPNTCQFVGSRTCNCCQPLWSPSPLVSLMRALEPCSFCPLDWSTFGCGLRRLRSA